MKPIFTIHAGEYLAVDFIQKKFKNVSTWIPTRDTGIDLLVTDRQNRKTCSLQVKFSRDYLPTHFEPMFRQRLRACCWWTLNRKKIATSEADYWVFVLFGFNSKASDFVVIPPNELLKRLDAIHGNIKTFRHYLWVTNQNECWETRGLKKSDHQKVSEGTFDDPNRTFTKWLNNWTPIEKLNRQ